MGFLHFFAHAVDAFICRIERRGGKSQSEIDTAVDRHVHAPFPWASDGWKSFRDTLPETTVGRNALIEIFREGWDRPMLTTISSLDPALNVYRLYWRLPAQSQSTQERSQHASV